MKPLKPLDIRQAVIKHAASPSNPPKGYGLELGMIVAKFRGDRTMELRAQGVAIGEAMAQAQREITERWGNPT